MASEAVPQIGTSAELADLVSRAQNLTGASGAAIALRAGEDMVTVASSGASAPDVGVQVRIQGSFAGHCVQTGVLQVCDDTETDPRVDAAACRALNVRSMVASPVRHGDRVAGVLAVFAPEPHWFVSSRVSLINVLADILSELVQRTEPQDTHAAFEPAPVAPRSATLQPAPALVAQVKPSEAMPEPQLPDALAEIAAFAQEQLESVVEAAEGSTVVHIVPALEKEAPAAKAAPAAASAAAQAKVAAKHEARSVPRAELLPVASDPCEEGSVVAPPVVDNVPTFSALDAHPQGSRSVPKWIYVAAAIVLIAVAAWGFRGLERSGKASRAPQTTAATAVAPLPAAAPPLSGAVNAPASVPQVKPTAVTRDGNTAKVEESKPAAKPESVSNSAAPALVLKPGAPRGGASESDTAPPPLMLADAKVPVLITAGKPYIPNAPVRTTDLKAPQLLKKVAPIFPEVARRNNYSTTVVVNARINKDGSIGDIQVVRGMAMFHRAAADAVRQWRYKPAYLDGVAVESTVEIQLQFNAQKP